ncbi:MAG: hypothetical protein KF823_05880 [Xanthomonadales bacterium]|nr:hypothetical protein [Xanthomonadales bacterium]
MRPSYLPRQRGHLSVDTPSRYVRAPAQRFGSTRPRRRLTAVAPAPLPAHPAPASPSGSPAGRRPWNPARASVLAMALSLLAGLLLPLQASAAQYCARTVAQLSLALDLAEANNENNVIRIARGVIAPAAPSDGHLFFYLSSKDRSLEISGGWDPVDCSSQVLDPGSTRIEANGSFGLFQAIIGSAGGNARLRVHNLTLSGGSSDSLVARGLGLNVSGFQYVHGKVEIDRVVFADHHCSHAESRGCALNFSFGIKEVVVRNSLFHHNSAGGTAAIRAWVTEDIQPVFRLHNNTLVDNYAHAPDQARASAVEFLGDTDTILMYNNILFGNPTLNAPVPLPDLARDPAGAILGKHNNIAASAVTWTPDTSGNRSIPPVFAGRVDDYRLRGDSPLRDAGFNAGWPTHGLLELGGGPRVLGPTIDLGAYESDVLFNAGFGD